MPTNICILYHSSSHESLLDLKCGCGMDPSHTQREIFHLKVGVDEIRTCDLCVTLALIGSTQPKS